MYAKMIDDELFFSQTQKDDSWLPVVDGEIPEHDKEKEIVGVSRYRVEGSQIVKQYRVERKSNKERAIDLLADKVAERILSQIRFAGS